MIAILWMDRKIKEEIISFEKLGHSIFNKQIRHLKTIKIVKLWSKEPEKIEK